MASSLSVAVPAFLPESAAPRSVPPDVSPSVGINLPDLEGDFFRASHRHEPVDEIDWLFPGRNRHRPGHATLACALLPDLVMKAEARSNPGTDVLRTLYPSRVTWHPEEQPDFHRDLQVLPPPAAGTAPALQLSPDAGRRRTKPMVCRARTGRVTPHTVASPRPRRRALVLPVVMLAAISVLGYLAAVQSVSAFQSAWRSTDTRLQSDEARAKGTFRAEDGDIPGPFARVPTGWSDLTTRFGSAPSGAPSAGAAQ